jgi:hypothetical protein
VGQRKLIRATPHAPLPHPLLLLQRNVGSGAGEVPEAPSPRGDRRLELPFSFEVAARTGPEAASSPVAGDYLLPLNGTLARSPRGQPPVTALVPGAVSIPQHLLQLRVAFSVADPVGWQNGPGASGADQIARDRMRLK